MFRDKVEIYVEAGRGGEGCISFCREKFKPFCGPDGGNGGKGGDVILKTDRKVSSLEHLVDKARYRAEHGMPGRGKKQCGRNGSNLIIPVPVGTVVRDKETGFVLKDMDKENETLIVARGGKGGIGNYAFRSSTNQAPKFTKPPQNGEKRTLILELKVIADVGIVGLPNSGKTTLLTKLTGSSAKVGEYEFTTLTPNTGVLDISEYQSLVIADIPGIIEGASNGKGLGLEFLRHIERTKLLLYLIDLKSIKYPDPYKAFEIVKLELKKYSSKVYDKPYIIVGNKLDLPGAKENFEILKKAIGKQGRNNIVGISAVTGEGVDKLVKMIAKKIFATR